MSSPQKLRVGVIGAGEVAQVSKHHDIQPPPLIAPPDKYNNKTGR